MNIVREILRDDIETDPVALSKLTGLPIKKIWAMKGGAARYLKAHPPEPQAAPVEASERVSTPKKRCW